MSPTEHPECFGSLKSDISHSVFPGFEAPAHWAHRSARATPVSRCWTLRSQAVSTNVRSTRRWTWPARPSVPFLKRACVLGASGQCHQRGELMTQPLCRSKTVVYRTERTLDCTLKSRGVTRQKNVVRRSRLRYSMRNGRRRSAVEAHLGNPGLQFIRLSRVPPHVLFRPGA
jgi:hypothetical protein